MTAASTSPGDPAGRRKPQDSEIDVFGLTHPGKLRKENQDHFLIASLNRQMQVHLTSMPDEAQLPQAPERMAFLALVADGVGSGAGEEASRFAVQSIAQYIMRTVRTSYAANQADPDAFARELVEAALQCHAGVLERAAQDASRRSMATTLTLWIGMWPTSYLLQVGDSRCYIYNDSRLAQVSRDQTMAQALVDQGLLTQTRAHSTRWAHVLASAIGGSQAEPVVTQFDQRWGLIGLLCSDGLTKHVPDERIAERLSTMTSAQQVCEALLQDALDDGGSDNITIVVGRTIKKD